MKTIKVIDLLVNIANGEEVPKKIKVYNDIFVYDSFNKVYWNSNNNNLFSIYKGNILNYAAEIIEDTPKEDKKIEKLNCKYTSDVSKLKVANKVDEIIELLNNSMLLSEKEVGKFLDKVNGEDNENRNV